MASFNKIVIVGYLGRDPEIRYTPQGMAACSFSIATTERRKDKSGEFQDQTTWFRVTCWGKQAEFVNERLQKGNQVYVEGRLTQSEYTDKDGNTRTSLEVNASDVQLLERAQKADDEGQPNARNAAAMTAQRPAQAARPTGKFSGADESDIPF